MMDLSGLKEEVCFVHFKRFGGECELI